MVSFMVKSHDLSGGEDQVRMLGEGAGLKEINKKFDKNIGNIVKGERDLYELKVMFGREK